MPVLTHTRRLGVATLVTVVALTLAALVLPVLDEAGTAVREGAWTSASFEDLLVWLCAAVALAAGACWWLGTLRLVAAARPGVTDAGVPTPAGVPTWLRRLVLAACGVALVVGPTSSATAAGGGADPSASWVLPTATGDRPAEGPGGLPLPDRVAGQPERSASAPTRLERGTTPALAPREAPRTPVDARAVRVTSGDSLWLIAAAQLTAETGRPPDDTAVAARWQQIYAANRDRIGPDPDLILPGQHLDLDES